MMGQFAPAAVVAGNGWLLPLVMQGLVEPLKVFTRSVWVVFGLGSDGVRNAFDP